MKKEDVFNPPPSKVTSEPPAGIQTRTLAWTYNLTVRELRGWLNQIPDDAAISMWVDEPHSEMGIGVTWEVLPPVIVP